MLRLSRHKITLLVKLEHHVTSPKPHPLPKPASLKKTSDPLTLLKLPLMHLAFLGPFLLFGVLQAKYKLYSVSR